MGTTSTISGRLQVNLFVFEKWGGKSHFNTVIQFFLSSSDVLGGIWMCCITSLLLLPLPWTQSNLLKHKPATDIRNSAQPTSTSYPASTNKEPLRGISRNNKVTLHVILLGVGGTIYNQYTITPRLNLGVPMHKVHQLATKLHCHAIKNLNKNKTQNTP
jgi:hypothetical protein